MQSSSLIFCTGAPLNQSDDKEFANEVQNFRGKKVVCGGTTAKIIAREMCRSISVIPNPRGVLLPPESKIAGIDIVSEGVITLACVRNLLQDIVCDNSCNIRNMQRNSVDSRILQMLLSHRTTYMVVGTRLNEAHFDPSLPITLERRVDVMTEIADILRNEFRKRIEVRYF